MTEHHTGKPDGQPDNVVPLAKTQETTDRIMQAGQETELERRRKIIFRALEIAAAQLEHDANELCTKAVCTPAEQLPQAPREQMIHTAFSLREASGWIRKALLPGPENVAIKQETPPQP